MNREKQIEEMAEVLRHSCENECFKNKDGHIDCEVCEACLLYEAGYRKQSEGEWIDNDDMYTADMLNYRCSICGNYEYTPQNFCSKCGAKMKGGGE